MAAIRAALAAGLVLSALGRGMAQPHGASGPELAPVRDGLALPTPDQAAWQDLELGMFIHIAPQTWQDSESDNLSTPLSAINPQKLDTDQWVGVAESMGARSIVFVAKHEGGFCWWPTETTDYSVKGTPWRAGGGDVMADLAASCAKRGMKLGVYLSPRDLRHGVGNGGRADDPAKQGDYEKMFRAQLTELLTRYGEMSEVWFDGSLVFDVGDILREHAPHAMVFQGPQATIRWVGNEDGIAPDPAWNAAEFPKEGLKWGDCTAADGDPAGNRWLPNECDARIRSTWFWRTDNENSLKSVDQLMTMYDQSVGRGATLLLNVAPDRTGAIPAADAARAAEFGADLRRQFGSPAAENSGRGRQVRVTFRVETRIDRAAIAEDITQGERVRGYSLEGWSDAAWKPLAASRAIGHRQIVRFKALRVTDVRLRITDAVGEPIIRSLAVYAAPDPGADGGVPAPDDALLGAASACDAAHVGGALQAGANPNATDDHGQAAILVALRGEKARGEGAAPLGTIRLLLDHGADASAADAGGVTALMMAAQRHDPALVGALLDHGARAADADQHGATALMRASTVRAGESPESAVEVIRVLAAHGAPIGASDAAGATALHYATQNSMNESGGVIAHPEVVSALLAAGADPNARAADGRTPLAQALQTWNGPIEVVRILLENGADVNAPDAEGSTPLMHAAKSGEADKVLLLIARHADLAAADHAGATALRVAAEAGKPEIVILLAGAGADLTAAGFHSRDEALAATHDFALIVAAGGGESNTVSALLAQGASPTARDRRGRTALLAAADSYSETDATTAILLAHGAGVDQRDTDGNTALILGASRHQTDAMQRLLDGGANINAKNAAGRTALLNAAEAGDPRAVTLLLARGADPNARDAAGRSALLLDAPHALSGQVASALLEAGADPNAADDQGRTPLLAGAEGARSEVIEVLLAHGADVNVRDHAGLTVLALARRAVNGPDIPPADADELDAIIALLKRAGAPE